MPGLVHTLVHIQNKIRDIMQVLFFFCRREPEDYVLFLFLFYFIVLLSLLILILKIRIKDTMKAYFCYRHTLL